MVPDYGSYRLERTGGPRSLPEAPSQDRPPRLPRHQMSCSRPRKMYFSQTCCFQQNLILKVFRRFSGRFWTVLTALGVLLDRSWQLLAALAEVLARSRSWGGLGSSRGDLGPVLGSPGGILGGHRAVRGRLGAISISI